MKLWNASSRVAVLLVMSCNASAVGFGDLLNKAKDLTSNIVENDSETEQKIPKRIMQIMDLHEYEEMLSPDEKHCTQLVDPFEYSQNVNQIFTKKSILKDGKAWVTGFIKTGSVKDAKNKTLDLVKISAKKMNWLPMEQEITYGKLIHEDRLENDRTVLPLNGKGRVKRQYRQVKDLLIKILNGVEQEYPYTFEVLLIDNNDVNATALPGGFLHINTGVLKSEQAELVLSHELGHVFKRHQTRETQSRLIDAVESVDELKSLINNEDKAIERVIKKTVNLYGKLQNYSRQQELQSDACAVRLAGKVPEINLIPMINAYIDSITATSNSMNQSKAEQTDKVLEMFKLNGSGHPDYPDRKDIMLEVAEIIESL